MASTFFSKNPKPLKPHPKKIVEGTAHFNVNRRLWMICAGIKTMKMYNIHPKSDQEKVKGLKMGEMITGQIVRGKFRL